MGKFGRIALKTLLWIVASVIFLILLVVVLIQIPAVQNFAKNKAVTFLQNKIHTKVEIGHISLGLPKLLVLEDVYFEDQKKDTLLAGEKLKVDISMLKLLHSQVEINEINLQGITTHIYRDRDSIFNFDYIIKAFAGEQKKPDTTKSTLKFSLDKINLDRINVAYKDLTTGNDVKFILGHFDTRIKDFDMDKMKFTIPKITLSGFNARIIQTLAGSTINQVAAVDTAVKPINILLSLGTIDLSKINIDYRSNEMTAKVDMNKFLVDMDKIDLKNQRVGIKNIELNDTKAAFTFAKPKTIVKAAIKAVKKLDTLVSAQNTKPWTATITSVKFVNDDIKYDNEAMSPIARGLDYAHMHVHNLNADVENISFSPEVTSAKVNDFTFNEKSGLTVKKFHTTFFYGPKNAYLNNLLVETPQTVLQKEVRVSYPSIASVSKNIGLLRVNANLNGSRLALKDVLLLMPTMRSMEPFKSSPNAVFRINGKVAGQVSNLKVDNFELAGLTNTHIKASAVIKGLPDINKVYADVNLADFNTSQADIAKLLPAGTIPSSVTIPPAMNLKGTFKGGMKAFTTKLNLRSAYGAVDLNATMKNGSNKRNAAYSAIIKATDLNVGVITKQPQMVGKVTMTANVKGVGLDPKTASLQFSGDVAQAYVKGYNYKNLVLKGTAKNGSYVANARMKDPNINFSLDAKANLNKKYPSVSGTLLMDSINLKALKLTADDMRFHGKIIANIPTADPDYLNADIQATDLLLVNKGQRIRIDSASLISTANADSSTLRLKTPFMMAHMGGKYKLTQVGPAVQGLINKYFNMDMASANTAKTNNAYSPQQFTFSLRINKTPLINQFVPDLKQMQPIAIDGRFNSTTGELVVNGGMPRVVYGTNTINNLKLNINTANNALSYNITADEIKSGSSIDLLNTSVTGNAQNNKLNINLQVRDLTKKERYRIAGVFSVLPNQYQFSFIQNGLLLNYIPWTVNPDNALQFGSRGILARNFTMTNANQVLSANSTSNELNSPIKVQFQNFQIETLTRMAQQDSLQVGGTVNGDVNISNFQKNLEFTAALNINNFSFKGDTVGNVALKVNNQTANAYTASMSITGYDNQVDMNGVYYTAPESKFDLNLNIIRLNMKSIQGFSFGAIRNSSGTLTGQLKITGTTSAPSIRGDVNFNKVGFNVAMLNSYFTMPQESITFNNDGIRLNDFTLVDSTGNKAVVTGTVYTKNYSDDFKFGIDINANNFRVVNSTAADNKLFYGKLYVNTDIKIRGDMNKPVVDAVLTVNDKTDFTIVLPGTDPGVEDRKGVVEVIDQKAPKLDSILLAKQLDSLRHSEIKGLDVNATINVNKAANFNVVVDPRNGDMVHIKGEAHLNGGIDPSGKTSLTGTYVVDEGSYTLSYATVNRKFNFRKGSTITWTGDPTTANIDLTAIYVANVPPIDLVSDQLGDDVQTTTMYKQKLPFNVDLNLRNELLKPDITFDIVLPDSTYTVSPDVISTVDARLTQIRQDPNEMNKQVLGVLVLGHFIGDNPLQSLGGSTGVNGLVRNSVSSLLSDQLNKLAGDAIAGVQLSFDLTSGADYSTGVQQNRTDLNVGLSKQFLNDRLTVTVGNNFNLEGQNQPGQKASDIAGNLAVNYKLTKDGRYLIRFYRRDQYIVVQGQVIETGLSFSLTYEYNRFLELFKRKPAQDREMQKQYRKDQREKRKEEKDAKKEHDATVADVQPADKPKEQKQIAN